MFQVILTYENDVFLRFFFEIPVLIDKTFKTYT